MRYRYFTCDVFTEQRFGGNPLAVLPEARGLSDEQMQQITREFNFSESTFVFPAEQGNTRKVRIFTPTKEIAFAGHPNVGTAFVLANAGELGELADLTEVTFEEQAGVVPVSIHRKPGKPVWCELKVPGTLSLEETVPVERVAKALSLTPEDITTEVHQPQNASVGGLSFIMVELTSREALAKISVNVAELEAMVAEGMHHEIHAYVRADDEFDIRARMFAPLDGIPEDPATGSANCALVAMLSHYREEANGRFNWRIAQGVEMGRPSILEARTEKENGSVTGIWIGGSSVMVSEGYIEVD
ncbi:MAG: PhzF family phenazine biosynthesis protein [Chromatiales bacterium]|nr:PhzF family phenazine biosynthesis protein [Chromatiales bacterium]